MNKVLVGLLEKEKDRLTLLLRAINELLDLHILEVGDIISGDIIFRDVIDHFPIKGVDGVDGDIDSLDYSERGGTGRAVLVVMESITAPFTGREIHRLVANEMGIGIDELTYNLVSASLQKLKKEGVVILIKGKTRSDYMWKFIGSKKKIKEVIKKDGKPKLTSNLYNQKLAFSKENGYSDIMSAIDGMGGKYLFEKRFKLEWK